MCGMVEMLILEVRVLEVELYLSVWCMCLSHDDVIHQRCQYAGISSRPRGSSSKSNTAQ